MSTTFIFVAQAAEYSLSVGNRHHVCNWSLMCNTEFVSRQVYLQPVFNKQNFHHLPLSDKNSAHKPTCFTSYPGGGGDPQVTLLFSPKLCIYISKRYTRWQRCHCHLISFWVRLLFCLRVMMKKSTTLTYHRAKFR